MTSLVVSLMLAAAAQGAVVPVSLSRPTYPAIALRARVAGEVEVVVYVRPDGSVESATAVAGSALLVAGALEAVKNSRFECQGCNESTAYSVVFAFLLDPEDSQSSPQGSTTSVTSSQSRVTVVGESPIADIYFVSGYHARAQKCLYLWHCGYYSPAREFYYYELRSPKCLWLWKCDSGKRGEK